MKGKVVLIPFPFTDLTTAKLRPALVLLERDRDVVVVFISSRLPQKPVSTDIVIDESHLEFQLTGLKTSSVIKLDKVATITKDLIIGEIGEIQNNHKKKIKEKHIQAYVI